MRTVRCVRGVEHTDGSTHDKTVQCSSKPRKTSLYEYTLRFRENSWMFWLQPTCSPAMIYTQIYALYTKEVIISFLTDKQSQYNLLLVPFSSTQLTEEIWIKPEVKKQRPYSLFWFALLDKNTPPSYRNLSHRAEVDPVWNHHVILRQPRPHQTNVRFILSAWNLGKTRG